MQIDPSFVFASLAALISVGGIFISVGVVKGKIAQNDETNKVQTEQMKALASKADLSVVANRSDEQLTAAIRRSDEMLMIMTKRAEEDRAKGTGQYREFYSILNSHAERISALETQQSALTDSLKEIKGDIKDGFNKLQEELKELRKRV